MVQRNDNDRQGKIKYIGLSEVSARTLYRAVKVEHVDAVQLEYSPFSLECEQDDDERYGVKKACEELGVALVAYSPLGQSSGESMAHRDKKTRKGLTVTELGRFDMICIAIAITGRGMMTGKYRSPDDLAPDDGRRWSPDSARR